MIAVKRAYDPVSRADGTRVLVERLWPRGLSRAHNNAVALQEYLGAKVRRSPRAAAADPQRRSRR